MRQWTAVATLINQEPLGEQTEKSTGWPLQEFDTQYLEYLGTILKSLKRQPERKKDKAISATAESKKLKSTEITHMARCLLPVASKQLRIFSSPAHLFRSLCRGMAALSMSVFSKTIPKLKFWCCSMFKIRTTNIFEIKGTYYYL